MTKLEDLPEALLDSSVMIPALLPDRLRHKRAVAALMGRRVGLAGRAAIETYSVISRLPGEFRRSPEVVLRLLETSFPYSRALSERHPLKWTALLAERGISGGAVYDGLIGAVAAEYGVPLITADRRAGETYQRIGARVEFI